MSQQGLSLLQCIWPSWLWQYEGHDGNHYKSKDNSLSWRSRSNLLLKDSSSSPNNATAAPLVDFHNGSTPTLPSSPVPTYLVWLEWRYIPPPPRPQVGYLPPLPSPSQRQPRSPCGGNSWEECARRVSLYTVFKPGRNFSVSPSFQLGDQQHQCFVVLAFKDFQLMFFFQLWGEFGCQNANWFFSPKVSGPKHGKMGKKNPKRGQHSFPEVAYLCPAGLPILKILWSKPTKSEIPSSRTIWKISIPVNCPEILPFQVKNLILGRPSIEAIVKSKPVSWFMGR